MNKLNIFSFAGIVMFFTCAGLIFLSLKYGKRRVHKIWALFNLSVGLWGLGSLFIGLSSTPEVALLSWRVAHIGGIFIPIFFYHVVVAFCRISRPRLVFFAYAQGVVYLVLNAVGLLFNKTVFLFNSIYYIQAIDFYYYSFTIIWFLLVLIGHFELFLFYKQSQYVEKNQVLYFFLGTLVGFLGGATNFLPMYSIPIYPFGNITIPFYCLIVSYAIIRYRLMDISLIVTRTTLFIAVYSVVLGIPFALAFGGREKLIYLLGDGWWMVPLVTSTVLATVGPFIYLYIQNRAEDKLLQEQRRYQSTLRQASAGMGKIKDLKRLVTLIVHIMTKTVRVEFSMVFLNDSNNKKFRLAAYRSSRARMKFRSDLSHESAIVQTLQETQNPIVYDEIKQRTQDYGDLKLARLETELKAMDASLVVPSFIDEKLIAILVMGSKISGKTYSSDDLSVFTILANQSALAIENAQFYDEMKNTHIQLLKAEKMATIGTLADGLSHQINNRLHAMGFIAGDALDTLKLGHNLPMSLEVKEMILDLEHALNRIESNVQQGGEIVQGLLKYTRKDDASVKDIELDKLIDAALEMTQFKIKPGEMSINHEYANTLPKIRGNFTQLQEVFFNLIDNAYDAMMQRKAELKEPDYHPTIRISANGGDNGHLTVIVADNGIGIQDQDKEKIFTPFFTTKLSSKKGTGLGLYVIQRLIEENHKGKVVYESKYKQGTTVHLTLPAA